MPAAKRANGRRNRAEEITRQLRRAIVLGEIKPGTPLAEPVLAERRTPWAAILFTTALAVLLIATGSLEKLADTTVALLVVVFAIVNVTVLVLRRDEVDHDHFRVPFVFPILGVGVSIALLTQIGNDISMSNSSTVGSTGTALLEGVIYTVLSAIPEIGGILGNVFETAFNAAVASGTLKVSDFDPQWAEPTYRLVRIGVIAFGLVVAYPYIPGSESEAFKGLSIFAGVLFSIGSSSFI